MKPFLPLQLGLALLMCALSARAEWPERSLRFIEPYAPGTALDAQVRHIANELGPKLKMPIVVEHRAGANGLIGTDAVAKSAPDGYTFLFTGPGHYTNEFLMKSIPYDSLKDFKPVARLASPMLALVVPASSPYNNLKELLAAARQQPGKLTYSSGGSGSASHLATAGLLSAAKVQVLHVPYKTQAQALTDTVSGQVDFTLTGIPTAAAQLKAGRLKALAVTGTRRSETLPDVPTVAEQGIEGYSFASFSGVFAPAGTPDDIVRRFSSLLAEEVKKQAFVEMTRIQGIDIDFADWKSWDSRAERKKWQDLITTSGAQPE
jgi:tripartite-type tricarboxylate transporter receptor subunit TctC